MGASVSALGVLEDAVCSGQMIGYYTAVTAAHCIWDRLAAYPYPVFPIATGVVTTLNQWGGKVQTRNSPSTVCYDRYYPSQWPVAFSWDFDYAVIEFGGCELPYPGQNGNWIGAGGIPTQFTDQSRSMWRLTTISFLTRTPAMTSERTETPRCDGVTTAQATPSTCQGRRPAIAS